MQQWFNLLFLIAKPAFKSLIYAGTNNLLNSLQSNTEQCTEFVLIYMISEKKTSFCGYFNSFSYIFSFRKSL